MSYPASGKCPEYVTMRDGTSYGQMSVSRVITGITKYSLPSATLNRLRKDRLASFDYDSTHAFHELSGTTKNRPIGLLNFSSKNCYFIS